MLQRIRRIDGSIVLILLLLMCVSIFSIYSVTHGRVELDGTHIRMIQYYVLGFIAFFCLPCLITAFWSGMDSIFTSLGSVFCCWSALSAK